EFPWAFPPIAQAPNPISETWRPVLPSDRRRIGVRTKPSLRIFPTRVDGRPLHLGTRHGIANEFRSEGFKCPFARKGPASGACMHAKAILLVLCLLATAIAAIFAAPVSRAATVINGQLVEETGPTSVLGGGDHVFVRFGSAAAFGVAYGTTGRFSDYFNRLDTLYKKVDLRTNWSRDTIQQSSDSTNRTWTFNLTAGNLSYANVANHTGSTALPPPTVRFTFHLNASLEEVNNATVPQWRVTVDTAGGRNDVVNFTRMANLVVSGKAVHYDLKWDQSISGWSYDGANTGTRRRLFLELGAVVGNLIPAALVDAWFDARAMGRFGETGT